MKNRIVYPNFENSLLNLNSSFLQIFDISPQFPALKQFDAAELKTKKNIVFLILDGLGNNLLERFGDVFPLALEHRLDPLTSVFPPTTTAAITSLMTGQSPFEHGAIGWSLYFKEYLKLIDFLPQNDSISQKKISDKYSEILNLLPAENIFQKIQKKNSEIKLYHISPKSIYKSDYNRKISSSSKIIPYENLHRMFRIVKHLLSQNERKLIVIYSQFPDALEHRFGVFSGEVRDFMQKFNFALEKFLSKSKKTNSSLIISADHGLIDVKKYHHLNTKNPIYRNLILPIFPEPRFASFFVKPHRIAEFEESIKPLKDEFLFLKREDFLHSALLGNIKLHPRLDDFIGNYVGIAVSDSAFKNDFPNAPKNHEFMAHHSGLTAAEMLVPLIKIDF